MTKIDARLLPTFTENYSFVIEEDPQKKLIAKTTNNIKIIPATVKNIEVTHKCLSQNHKCHL